MIIFLLLLFTFIFMILVLYRYYSNMEKEKIIYVIWNIIMSLSFLQYETRKKLANCIIRYYLDNYGNDVEIQDKEKYYYEKINIPNHISNWNKKIEYCHNKDGIIKNIHYDEFIKPSKSSFVLY